MLHFVICDDNLNLLQKLSSTLENIFTKYNYDASVSFQTDNVDSLLQYVDTNKIDVLFLDINLKSNKTGLEVAEMIRKKNKDIYLIFTTGHLEYAMLAYKFKTFDYIAKPFTTERLEDTVVRLFEDIHGLPTKYLKIDNKNTIIDENEIEPDNASQLIGHFVNAFKKFDNDYDMFAQYIYKVKLIARAQKEPFWSLLCDLLIGYSYQKLESVDKAEHIFNDVLTISQKSGMGLISTFAAWFIANLKYELHEYDVASKLIGDNIIAIARTLSDVKAISILSYILQINIIVSQNSVDTDIEPILYKINYACERYNLQYLQTMLVDYQEYIEKYKQNVEAKKAEAEQVAAEQEGDASTNETSETQDAAPAPNSAEDNSANTTDS